MVGVLRYFVISYLSLRTLVFLVLYRFNTANARSHFSQARDARTRLTIIRQIPSLVLNSSLRAFGKYMLGKEMEVGRLGKRLFTTGGWWRILIMMVEHAPFSWSNVSISPRFIITVISQTVTTIQRNDSIPEPRQLHQCLSRTSLAVQVNNRERIRPTGCRIC